MKDYAKHEFLQKQYKSESTDQQKIIKIQILLTIIITFYIIGKAIWFPGAL